MDYTKKSLDRIINYLYRIGKSLMFAVAILQLAGLLYGAGYWMESFGNSGLVAVSAFFLNIASVILDNMPLLFAVSIAAGMSVKANESAAIGGIVAWLVVTVTLSDKTLGVIFGNNVPPAFSHIGNTFIGILSGLLAAGCYNRFHDVKLPEWLAFFNGQRMVPLVTAFFAILFSIPLFFLWPFIYALFGLLGEIVSEYGNFGVGIYACLNRLLVPFGLHHSVNDVFWHSATGAGLGDMEAFWSYAGVRGKSGVYMTGFFPIFMFGLPAAALAMYHMAKDDQKKATASLMLSGAVTAFFTGVTEPLELSFLFLAPGLYLLHAVLTGIFSAICAALPLRLGFHFSAGFVDWLVSGKAPQALNPWLLFPVGILAAIAYYSSFRFLIWRFDLKTPGRGEIALLDDLGSKKLAGNRYSDLAWILMDGLGGKENVESLVCSEHQVLAELADYAKMDEKKLRMGGALSTKVRPTGASAQIRLGEDAKQFYVEMRKIMLQQ